MKNKILSMSVVALTMWLGFVAGTANAVPSVSPFGGSPSTGYTATFSSNGPVASSFNDWLYFGLPSSGSGAADVVGNLVTVSHILQFNVDFSAVNLWDMTTITQLSSGSGSGFAYSSWGSGQNISDLFALNVAGNIINPGTVGSYGGTITVDPVVAVPEPKTYAMLLVGLGLLLFSARRRKDI